MASLAVAHLNHSSARRASKFFSTMGPMCGVLMPVSQKVTNIVWRTCARRNPAGSHKANLKATDGRDALLSISSGGGMHLFQHCPPFLSSYWTPLHPQGQRKPAKSCSPSFTLFLLTQTHELISLNFGKIYITTFTILRQTTQQQALMHSQCIKYSERPTPFPPP